MTWKSRKFRQNDTFHEIEVNFHTFSCLLVVLHFLLYKFIIKEPTIDFDAILGGLLRLALVKIGQNTPFSDTNFGVPDNPRVPLCNF